MPALVQNGIPIFTDIDGDPLEDGYIYIGEAGLNPLSNPLQAYWDADLTVPAGNLPTARTKGGAASYNGAPSRLYVATNYSILVQDKKQRTVYSVLNSVDYYNSPSGDLVSQTDTLATLREITPLDNNYNVKVKGHTTIGDITDIPEYYWDISSTETDNNGSIIRPSAIDEGSSGRFVWKNIRDVNIRWFGADPTGSTDSSTAFVNAFEYIYSYIADTLQYKSRPTLFLDGGSYSIDSGFLTIDSSKIRIDGNGGSIDFSSNTGETQFVLLTNTGDLDDTYSNPLCAIENVAINGRGRAETTNNTGILINTSTGGTVSTGGVTLRNLSISGFDIGIDHQDSSYNITYDTCNIFRNNTSVLYTNSSDMFERSTFLSCTIFNSGIGIECNAANGTIYYFGGSIDYNDQHVVMTAGGIELHGTHIEGTLDDIPHFSVSGNAVFNAYGGWWQFVTGTLTTTQEFDVSGSNGILTVIKDVRFSSFNSGIPFTLNPELMDVINAKPDSTSLLSLRRFDTMYATYDRFFDEGVIRNNVFLIDGATTWTDRYTNNCTAISVVNDPANAYSGNNYLLVDKKFGSGTTCQVYMVLPLTDKRRGTVNVRLKALAGSTASVNIDCLYAVMSPSTTTGKFIPYDIIQQRSVGQVAVTLSANYQRLNFGMREKARPSDTHIIARLNFFNVNNTEVAVDDFYISLI